MSRLTGRIRAIVMAVIGCVAAFLAASVVAAPPAAAASLVQVTNFGNNPTNLQMYLYVPNNVGPHPAILLALHNCTGSGPSSSTWMNSLLSG